MQFTQDDRDLLLKHDVKIGTLCGQITDLRQDVKDGFKDLGDKLENNSKDLNAEMKSFMPKKLLLWILTFIILGTISLTTYTGALSNKVILNTHKINYMIDNNNIIQKADKQ